MAYQLLPYYKPTLPFSVAFVSGTESRSLSRIRTRDLAMASDLRTLVNGKAHEDSTSRLPATACDSIQRLMESWLPDLDGTVETCLHMSMEGVGGLGLEHWIGRDRPFATKNDISYRALLKFVKENAERIRQNSQDLLHYIGPWYEWALVTAESKLVVTFMSRSEDLGTVQKDEIVAKVREAVLA